MASDLSRIVVNGRFLFQPLTGVQRYARELLLAWDELIAAGDSSFRVELARPPGEVSRPLTLSHIEERVVGRKQGHAWEQWELPREARGALLFCPANIAPARSLLGRQRVVITIHGLSFLHEAASYRPTFRWSYRWLTALAVRRAQRIITVSDFEAERFRDRWPQLGDRLVTVEHGNPTAVGLGNDASTGPNAAPYLLFVGTPTPSKNLGTLIEALAGLESLPDLRLRVVGAPARAYHASLPELPASLRHRVVFEGAIEDDAALGRLYRGAACLVHPSLYESSGLPPLEAMAHDCPVVCSDLPVLRSRCGDDAIYFDPHDANDLARQIERVVQDADLRAKLCAGGRNRVSQRTWQDAARETVDVLRGVVEDPRHS